MVIAHNNVCFLLGGVGGEILLIETAMRQMLPSLANSDICAKEPLNLVSKNV